MNDIFKIRALGVCKRLQFDEKTAFAHHELKAGDEFRNSDLPLNFILFVLGGMLEISCNQYENRRIQSDQMILLVRTSSIHIRVLKKTTLYLMYFDSFLSSCDQQLFNAYLPDTEKISYDFMPTTIPQPIVLFLEQMHFFQKQKIDCMHLNGIKHREFFILLRQFCPREDLVSFISPLIGRSLYFRNKVMEKYALLGNGRVTEFASLVGMGKKNFEKQFRKEFGSSPAKWMLEEKAKRLYIFLQGPDITIADAMDQFYFNSSAHFNRFCIRYFKTTPGMIIKEARQQKEKKKK